MSVHRVVMSARFPGFRVLLSTLKKEEKVGMLEMACALAGKKLSEACAFATLEDMRTKGEYADISLKVRL